MTQTIDFIFDFASPNAYLAYHPLKNIAARHSAELNLIPCLLGGIFKSTGNQAPMVAFGGVKGKLAYEMLEMNRFIEKHGLTKFQMNPNFPVNTVMIIRGLLAAEKLNEQQRYVDTVLKAMWEDGKAMGDEATIIEVLNDAGFNGAEIVEMTKQQEIKETLIDNTNRAVERGAFGVPTFFVGDEMFFGKDRLNQVEEALSR